MLTTLKLSPLQQDLREVEFQLRALEDSAPVDKDEASDEVCREIALLRARIAHACAHGAKSSALNELLERTDKCTPHNGLYQYWLGTAQFHAKLFEDAARRFELAGKTTSPEAPVSVNIQFNLAASLHELDRYAESIAVLRALISSGGPWAENPQFTDLRARQTLEINTAAMLVSSGANQDALNLLSEVDRDWVNPYWRQILWINEIQALNNLGAFAEADSIWSGHINNIPVEDVPLVAWSTLIECILSTASFDVVQDLRSQFQGVPDELSDDMYLAILLDPNLTEESLERTWNLAQVFLNFYRVRESEEARQEGLVVNSALKAEIDQLKQGVQQAEFQSQTWQQTALVSLAVLLLFVSVAFFRQWQKHRVIAQALQETVETNKAVAAESLFAKNLLSSDEIRMLHDGLTKGRRVGEAIMVLRRLEAAQDSEMEFDLADDQPHIEGWDQLNLKEKDIIRMTLGDEVPKEMAHKLGVSVGYIYNSRSAIRRKLEMPEDALFRFWLLQKLKESDPSGV